MSIKLQRAIDKLKNYQIDDSPYYTVSDGWKNFLKTRDSMTTGNLGNFLDPFENASYGIRMTNNSPEKEQRSFDLLKKITLRKNVDVETTIQAVSCENILGEKPLDFNSQKKITRSNLINAGTFHELLKVIPDLKKKNVRILEIGSGYGELARQIVKYAGFESLEYDCVDLPDNLIFAELYLSKLFGSKAVQSKKFFSEGDFDPKYEQNVVFGFYDPTETGALKNEYDLIINTYSFQEIEVESVYHYIQLIYKKLDENGLFFSLNSPKKWSIRGYSDYSINMFNNVFTRMHRQLPPAGKDATVPIVNVFKKKNDFITDPGSVDSLRTNIIGELQVLGFTELLRNLNSDATLSVTSPSPKLCELLDEISSILDNGTNEEGLSIYARVLARCISANQIPTQIMNAFLTDNNVKNTLSDLSILILSDYSNSKTLKRYKKEVDAFYGLKSKRLILIEKLNLKVKKVLSR